MKRAVEIAVKTDVGKVRTENQDHFCVVEPKGEQEQRGKGSLVVVADGMGGHTGGTVASHTAIDAIRETFKNSSRTSMRDLLDEAMQSGNVAVRTKAEQNPQMKDMGTTCVSLLVRGRHAVIAHLGDSRCYMFRDGKAEIVTRDHTYLNELVDIGLLTPEQAEGHPDKNIITRCVGMAPKLEVDFNHREIKTGDAFLMCSDGLSNFVKIDEMRATVEEHSAADSCAWLVNLANERGGEDNITCAVVKILDIVEVDGQLAKIDADEAQYNSRITPVIRSNQVPTRSQPVDSEADTAEGTARPEDTPTAEIKAQPVKPSPSGDLDVTVPIPRPKKEEKKKKKWLWSLWFLVLGAEIAILVALMILIGQY